MTTPSSEEIGAEIVQNGQHNSNAGGGTVSDEGGSTKETSLKEEEQTEEMANGETAAGVVVKEDGAKSAAADGADDEDEEMAMNEDGSPDDRELNTKTPPASQQRQTPPHSASIRAPIVRKRCSAVFGAQTGRLSASGSGGLSALTSAMLGNKKPRKQSMLDNAASGWRAFVQNEQLEQELESHMRSKDAYLDKQEFLLRADYSQFEQERDLRAHERRVQQQQQTSGNKPR